MPASGKSGVAAKISQSYGAAILDSDFAKRKLPEYAQYPWGASLVNAESSSIVFGDKNQTGFYSLFERAVESDYNIVIPKIGRDVYEILSLSKNLCEAKYEVHLTLVYLPKEKATEGALGRYIDTDRYVPLARIFDIYGNNPAFNYFLIKNAAPMTIKSYGIVNTDVAKKKDFLCTDILNDNPAKMFEILKNVLI